MEKNFYNIFKTFFKVGTLLLGGGYVILPLLTTELVEKKNWLTSDELCEYYAISASLPGVIAVNTAIFTGRHLLKTKGAIAATCGMILPAFTAIILLASLFMQISQLTMVKNIFWGVGLGIIVLLFLAIKEMWKKSVNDKFTTVVFILSFSLAISGKIPLFIIIILSLISGIVHQRKSKGEEQC